MLIVYYNALENLTGYGEKKGKLIRISEDTNLYRVKSDLWVIVGVL